MFQAPTPVVESIAPVPIMFQAPTPLVESIAPVPAVFPFSPDASDTSSPEDEYNALLGVVASAHQVFYTGRECGALEPGKRDADRVSWSRTSGLVAEMVWWVIPCGFARRLLGVGMRGGNSNVLGSFLRYEQHARRLGGGASGAGNEREEDEYEWHGFWRGCWGGCEVCAEGP